MNNPKQINVLQPRNSKKIGQVKLLDCTLRDGGHVNNWAFGSKTIKNVVNCLNLAGIDIIELGLLRNVASSNDSTLQPTLSSFVALIDDLECVSTQYFTVMIRPDWIDAQCIEDYDSHRVIKGIRFAFYPEDIELAYSQASIAREKGYDVYLNAVGVSCYSVDNLSKTLVKLSKVKPKAYSIVDTFGSFDLVALGNYYRIFEDNVDADAFIGLHLHENRSLALSLALNYLEVKANSRGAIIDGSLYGMGRVPGNLCIEQIASYLVRENSAPYQIGPIMQAIEESIYPIREKHKWGYSPEYMFSACENVNRNYAEFFIEEKLPLDKFEDALSSVRRQQGISFKYNHSLAVEVLESMSHITSQTTK